MSHAADAALDDGQAGSGGHRWRERLHALRDKRWWRWAKRGVALAFFVVVAALLIHQARGIAWGKVVDSIRAQSASTLLLAAALAAASHLAYSCFDLFGRRVTRHRLATPRVMATTFVSYVFNLNLGTLIGGLAFRYRLYTRQGLSTETVTTVIATSMLTNWLGYLLVGGLVLIFRPPLLPQSWPVADSPLRLVGIVMVALAVAWVGACRWSPRREWDWHGHGLKLPGARLAVLQLAASACNWMLMASILYVLLDRRIDYLLVLGTLMTGAIAGLLARVPGGLGVIEAVFVALLGSQLPSSELVGAVLLYRALYYWSPLLIALALQWLIESNAPKRPGDRRHGARGRRVNRPPHERRAQAPTLRSAGTR